MTDEAKEEEPDFVVDQGQETSPRADIEANESVEMIDSPLRISAPTAVVAGFVDHFSLAAPTSRIRYREVRSGARVVETDDSQLVLEETYDPKTDEHEVTIRRIHNTSEGVRVLRAMYAIVTAFWTGFLFIFCLQVLLFVFLDLTIQVGATTKQSANGLAAFGVILSIPAFVYGLASCLVIAGAFIIDTWRGHNLIKNFTFAKVNVVVVEWIFFAFFLGLPILVFCSSLLAGSDQFWEITSLSWFIFVLIFYCIFAFNVVFYEIRACYEVYKNRYKGDENTYWHVFKQSILLRQRSTYSGQKTVTYLSLGAFRDSEETDKGGEENMIAETRHEYMSWRAKLTKWDPVTTKGRLKMYEELDKPMRVYTVDDARDVRPYVTAYSWSLEKIFCRPKNSRYIAIVRGPGAVTRSQMRSSFACSILGTFLIFFVVFSLLMYLRAGGVFVGFFMAVMVIVAFPSLSSTYRLYFSGKDLLFVRETAKQNAEAKPLDSFRSAVLDNFDASESIGVYLVSKSYRMTKATDAFCWVMFGVEVVFLFLWPLIALFSVGNYPSALIFFFTAGVSGARYYFNASIVLEETGHLNVVDGITRSEKWKNQSRLSEIVGNITRGRSRGAWMAVLGTLGFAFLALFAGAVGTSQASAATDQTQFTYLDDFYYEQADSLRYPSCQLTNDLGDSPLTTMADFAYLAGLAYRADNITQIELDSWFLNNDTAIANPDLVNAWKSDRADSEVSFKFITFPQSGNFSYVAIRGTTNPWDMLTDAQLWSAAALMQALRTLLPLGEIWTPIMDRLIRAIAYLESGALDKVSFYRDTTAFVQYIQEQIPSTYLGVSVTGHSLGGGLSIITGAQTGVPAVALSGPNAVLSRLSFTPEVSQSALDSKTFNIIPARDVVPMIDDRAQNFQQIRCNTQFADVIGCHNSVRSLCEIIYTCGTGPRPAICQCATVFGYPPALPKAGTTRTFDEACGIV